MTEKVYFKPKSSMCRPISIPPEAVPIMKLFMERADMWRKEREDAMNKAMFGDGYPHA